MLLIGPETNWSPSSMTTELAATSQIRDKVATLTKPPRFAVLLAVVTLGLLVIGSDDDERRPRSAW